MLEKPRSNALVGSLIGRLQFIQMTAVATLRQVAKLDQYQGRCLDFGQNELLMRS
jgi:hypothetical protein